jgi:hypothetical protein
MSADLILLFLGYREGNCIINKFKNELQAKTSECAGKKKNRQATGYYTSFNALLSEELYEWNFRPGFF